MRVAILGTGRMELRGLPPALESLFRGHEFYPIFRNPKDLEPFHSFTSWGRALTHTQANPNLVAKEHKPGWHTEQREAHPKAFLKWLCRDPTEKNCTRYRETHQGVNALERLDWAAALSSLEHCTYLRAFMEDLADGLGESPAWPVGGRVSPHTDHREPRTTPMLRNI